MLKFVFKGLLLCLVIIGVAAYIGYLRTGQFWLPTLKLPQLSMFNPDSRIKMSTLQPPAEPTYKWQIQGRWHYGAVPPDGVDAILISADPE